MTAKVIFNWLIGVFLVSTISGIALGIYSVVKGDFIRNPETLARAGTWLFFGCGMACIICIAIRIVLGIVG